MRSAAAVLIVLSMAAPAAAQQPRPAASAETPTAQVNVDRLPLNLNRIHRQLRHAADLEEREGLSLRYTIQIYGSAPPIPASTDQRDSTS
jgi:hypothetical protein